MGLLDVAEMRKNSPDSNMPSCVMVIVAQSVVPEVRVKVNDSVIGVKSENSEETNTHAECGGER